MNKNLNKNPEEHANHFNEALRDEELGEVSGGLDNQQMLTKASVGRLDTHSARNHSSNVNPLAVGKIDIGTRKVGIALGASKHAAKVDAADALMMRKTKSEIN